MAARTDCYVDTGAFIAFLDRSDSHHALFRQRFSKPPALITSALVITEGHGWFLRRYDQIRATEFLAFISALRRLDIEPFGADALAKTGAVVKRYGDQALTLADAHGISIIRERRIGACWSTDRRLALSGAELVP